MPPKPKPRKLRGRKPVRMQPPRRRQPPKRRQPPRRQPPKRRSTAHTVSNVIGKVLPVVPKIMNKKLLKTIKNTFL